MVPTRCLAPSPKNTVDEPVTIDLVENEVKPTQMTGGPDAPTTVVPFQRSNCPSGNNTGQLFESRQVADVR